MSLPCLVAIVGSATGFITDTLFNKQRESPVPLAIQPLAIVASLACNMQVLPKDSSSQP